MRRSPQMGHFPAGFSLNTLREDLLAAPVGSAGARAQAVAVLRLGYLLASAQSPMEAAALVDVWRHYVLPHAITRDRLSEIRPSVRERRGRHAASVPRGGYC